MWNKTPASKASYVAINMNRQVFTGKVILQKLFSMSYSPQKDYPMECK